MVKVAIPIEYPNGMLSELNEHFGMAEDFLTFDYDRGAISEMKFVRNDPQKTKEPKPNAQFLVDNGVKIVLAGAIGPHMLQVLMGVGVRVFKGASGTVEDVIEDYKAGMLTEVHSAGGIE